MAPVISPAAEAGSSGAQRWRSGMQQYIWKSRGAKVNRNITARQRALTRKVRGGKLTSEGGKGCAKPEKVRHAGRGNSGRTDINVTRPQLRPTHVAWCHSPINPLTVLPAITLAVRNPFPITPEAYGPVELNI